MDQTQVQDQSLTEKRFSLGRQIFRFLLIGGICYLLAMGFLVLFVEVMDMEVNLANVLASLIVIVFNYFLNVLFVFERGRYKPWKEASAFVLFSLMGFSLNVLLMYLFTEYIPIHYTISKTIITLLVAAFNFVTRKFLVFKK